MRAGIVSRRAAALALVAGLLAIDAHGARRSLCSLVYPSDARVEWTCHTIGKGETLEGLFGERWVDVARFNRIDRRHVVEGLRIKVPRRLETVEGFTPMPTRYAPADSDSQFVLVDLSEQFLGAYEKGRLVFSAPIAAGSPRHPTPRGMFRITAYDRYHVSSVYDIRDTDRPYPMHYGLRFHVTASGMSYWIHGRDLPGAPASHGCIGLYDEAMQQHYYGRPEVPVLSDARRLFEWVLGSGADTNGMRSLADGPRVRITGSAVERESILSTPGPPRLAAGTVSLTDVPGARGTVMPERPHRDVAKQGFGSGGRRPGYGAWRLPAGQAASRSDRFSAVDTRRRVAVRCATGSDRPRPGGDFWTDADSLPG